MSVHKHTCYSVTCDVCDRSYGGGWENELHLDSAADIVGAAEENDWHGAPDGSIVCDNGDADHEAAIRAQHEAGMEDGHWCWLTNQDNEATECERAS